MDIKQLTEAADDGNAFAQFKLGCCYVKGLEIEKNHKEAEKMFRLAMNNGNLDAQCALALCYEYLHGSVYKDLAKYLCEDAAKKGNDKAKEVLSKCFGISA